MGSNNQAMQKSTLVQILSWFLDNENEFKNDLHSHQISIDYIWDVMEMEIPIVYVQCYHINKDQNISEKCFQQN